jgi:hypothetical protein
MRKVVLTDLAGDCLARFELPEAASVADVERLFVHESPHFSDAGLLMAARNGDRLLSRDETLVETSPDIGAEIIWVVIPDTMNA